MKISVIGTGYVGLVSGACFAEVGHDCICVDIDPDKVARINEGKAPIHEEGLQPILERQVGSRLHATTDLSQAVMDTEATFIAVGTPFDGERIDLTYVRQAAAQVGAVLADKPSYHVVVVKSTVVPGTTDGCVIPELERASKRRAGADLGVGVNPEFLTEGVAVNDFMYPDRIVIGASDDRCSAILQDIYAPFPDTPKVLTNNKTAEMIKYVSNSVLAAMISFSNEMGNLCSSLGDIDATEVMKGVHLARYFTTALDDGRRIEAPITSFLWPGCGYGGSCLPKDTKALSAHGAAHGASMQLLDAVIDTNLAQPARMVELLAKHFPSLQDLRVAVLGLAFKPDTDDMRESPAIPIIRDLVDNGVNVVAYDPVAMNEARSVLPETVSYAATLEEALHEVDAAMLVTSWNEFRALPALLAHRADPPLLIDGRRIIDRGSVENYDGIGL